MRQILGFVVLLFLGIKSSEAALDWPAICPNKAPPPAGSGSDPNYVPFLNQCQTNKEFKWIEYKAATIAGVERLSQNLNEYFGTPQQSCHTCLHHTWYSQPENPIIWPWRPTLYNRILYRTCTFDPANSWWICSLDKPFDASNPAEKQQALRYNTVLAHPVKWDSEGGATGTWLIFVQCFEDGLMSYHGVIAKSATGSDLARAKSALTRAFSQLGINSDQIFNHNTAGCCFN